MAWSIGLFRPRAHPKLFSDEPVVQAIRGELVKDLSGAAPPLTASRLPDPKGVVVAPEIVAARKLRAQLIRYELFANSGRYCSRASEVATSNKVRDRNAPHPFKWLAVPLAGRDTVQTTSPTGDARAASLASQLVRTIETKQGPVEVALVPVHWEEAVTLQKKFKDLIVLDDGEVHQTASPRSLMFGTSDAQVPRLVGGLERYSVKMHLSAESYARMGGLLGNRDLNKNDCLMASVFSHVMRQLAASIPRMEVQGEDATVAATLGSGDDKVEVGAIFRALPDELAVPGFALFSKTKERLPHVKDLPGPLRARSVDDGGERVLAVDALEVLRKKNPGLGKEDAFVRLFAEPLLDVVFGLYRQGATLEVHPQNFSLRFDEATGDVEKVVVRDLHGINYSAAWRKEHGLPDLCSVDALKGMFPSITQEDIDGWFTRPNPDTGVRELRDRYRAPGIFRTNIDFHAAIFFYQTLISLEENGYMSRAEVDRTMIKIRDQVEVAAEKNGFDLAQLDDGKATFSPTMQEPFAHGIRGRVLFRRPVEEKSRAAFIARHEAPLLAA